MKIILKKDECSEHLFYKNIDYSIQIRPYFTYFKKGFVAVINDIKEKECIYNSYIHTGKCKSIEELLKLISSVISKQFNNNDSVLVEFNL